MVAAGGRICRVEKMEASDESIELGEDSWELINFDGTRRLYDASHFEDKKAIQCL